MSCSFQVRLLENRRTAKRGDGIKLPPHCLGRNMQPVNCLHGSTSLLIAPNRGAGGQSLHLIESLRSPKNLGLHYRPAILPPGLGLWSISRNCGVQILDLLNEVNGTQQNITCL